MTIKSSKCIKFVNDLAINVNSEFFSIRDQNRSRDGVRTSIALVVAWHRVVGREIGRSIPFQNKWEKNTQVADCRAPRDSKDPPNNIHL